MTNSENYTNYCEHRIALLHAPDKVRSSYKMMRYKISRVHHFRNLIKGYVR